MVYQEEDYRLELMSILFDFVQQLVLPLFFVILLPPQFLLLRQLEGLRFTLALALAQTLTSVKDLHPHDYDCSQARHPHSHHLLRFYPFRASHQLLEVYFSVA